MTITVIKPGFLTSLQDGGRHGFAHLGIGRAGAFDAPALRIANTLCGNPRDACGLEVTLIGPTLRFDVDTCIAVTGAPLALTVDGIAAPMWTRVPIRAGATVALGALRRGCRSYLAVGGGIDVSPVLGSRSVDLNAALGPCEGRALRAGDTLPVTIPPGFDASRHRASTRSWWLDPRPWFDDDARSPLRVIAGAHFDRLTESSRNALFSNTFNVDKSSNRVGVRLQGPRLELTSPLELVSEACLPGLLQLPPSGQPIAFGPEGPVSGGYPRIGQIAAVDLPRLAQRRPGDTLRFTACSLDEALEALHHREHALHRLESAIATRISA